MNGVCAEMNLTRDEFYAIKTAFGITKDDVQVIDEDLDDMDNAIELSLQQKKKQFKLKLIEQENASMRKENENFRRRDYLIEKVRDCTKEIFENWESPTIIIPDITNNGQMYELPMYDVHLNKLSWEPETGENYDHKIAAERFNFIIDENINRLKGEKFERVIFPIGQDFFNSDTEDGKTTKGTPQDNDCRWAKMFAFGKRLLIDGIEKLKELGPVEVIYSPGNHDELTSFYVTEVIDAYFRNDDYVTVNTSPNPRKYIKFGKTMIGFTHLDKEKKRIEGDMQVEEPKMWADTIFREWHGGHLHSEQTREMNGIIIRNLSSITAKDVWHHKHGYSGAIARVQSFIYDKKRGPQNILITNVMR